jgi:hypothetical protein
MSRGRKRLVTVPAVRIPSASIILVTVCPPEL